jgi:hypothetical protein
MAKRLDFDFAFLNIKKVITELEIKCDAIVLTFHLANKKNSTGFRCRSRWENAQTGMDIFAITLLVRVAEKN